MAAGSLGKSCCGPVRSQGVAAAGFDRLILGAAASVGALCLCAAAFLFAYGDQQPSGHLAIDASPLTAPAPAAAVPDASIPGNLDDGGKVHVLIPPPTPSHTPSTTPPPAPMPAPDPDAAFLAAVQRDGVLVVNPMRLIANAHTACTLLSNGLTPDRVVDELTPPIFQRSRPVMEVVVAEANAAYCPDAGAPVPEIR
jgi:Protein of unknown function (DUF732)